MNIQNTFAIYAMCAIVISLYAIRNSEAHFLPDLFGLALAFTAPRQTYAIGAVIILAVIRHSWLAHGFAGVIPDWLIPVVLPGAYVMPISAAEAEALEDAYDRRISKAEIADGNTEILQPVAEIDPQIISSVRADLMAQMIVAGEIQLTKAAQLASGAKSGRKYQAASRQIKLAMEKYTIHYPELDSSRRQRPRAK